MNYTKTNSNTYKIYGIIGAFLALLIPYLLKLNNHNNHLDTDQSLCPLKLLTGFPCPSCGITKSMIYFYDGAILKSLHFHLLGPAAVVFCVFMIVLLIFEIITKKNYFQHYFYNKKITYGLAAFLILYHSYRLVYFVQTNTWSQILKESVWR
ncbi:MAG: DUF2752 domain-containing protein [Flavobacterium sp.]|nr:DUF2752 domain-containing protein [Flavobacterium sp.]